MQLFPILQKEFSFKMYLPRYSEKDIQLEDFEICVMELKLRENVVGEFCFCFSSLNRINKSQGVPAIEGRIRCSGVEWKWWKRAFAYPRVLHPGWLYDFHTQGVELPRTQKMEMGRQMWRNKIEIQLRFLSRLFGECIMIFFWREEEDWWERRKIMKVDPSLAIAPLKMEWALIFPSTFFARKWRCVWHFETLHCP